jgi:cysteinyl-tRNA synthetase
VEFTFEEIRKMALQVFNRLTREKEPLVPLHEGFVGIYVCGPTVYDYPHVGHAKTYVAFDVIVRYLRYSGYAVRYVQNITDVGHLLDSGEDRILRKAAAMRLEPMEVAEMYTRLYFEAMDALNVTRPDISPRASGHVPEQIEWVKKLLETGHAYEVSGNVYFDVTSFPEYGKLSGRRVEEMDAGARVEVREEKRHPADFALWKRAEPEHVMQWSSPWGRGFPGWHIECSAMSTKYLGQPFDIHGGGIDNIFPHNECEIAQTEAATSTAFCRYWLLTGSLTVEGIKMSKSLNNFITIHDVLQQIGPEALRAFVLSGHYSNPIDFSEAALDSAQKGWERLNNTVRLVRQTMRTAPESDAASGFAAVLDEYKGHFTEAMDDDFNTPVAMGALHELSREVNSLLNSGEEIGRATLEAIDALYRELGGDVLGIIPEEGTDGGGSVERESRLVEFLIDLRQEARAAKDYAKSDAIRDRLAEIGIILEDRADGTVFRFGE